MYRPSVKEVVEIQTRISQGTSQFDNVLSMTIFPIYLATQQKDLIEYLLKNFRLVFHSALNLRQTTSVVQNRCLLLFTDEKNIFNQLITKEQYFLTLLLSFVKDLEKQKPKTKTSYFTILNRLGKQNPMIYKTFSDEKILPLIIKNISNSECNSFVSALISDPNLKNSINSVNLPSLIIKAILNTNDSKREIEDLFLQLISTSYVNHNEIALSLISNNELAQIIQDAIEHPSANDFMFIKEILHYSYQNQKNKSWVNISTVIESRLKDIVSILLRSERFTATSEAISLIVIEILKNPKKEISNEILDVFYKLQSDFFKYPKHGILHNIFVTFLRELDNKKYLTFDFLNSIHLFDTIFMINEENSKFVSYRAQIREIALIIDPYFHKTDKVSEDKWSDMINKFKEKQVIIKKPYGGKVSKYTKRSAIITILSIVAVIIIIFLIGLFILYRKIKYRRYR